MGEKTLLLGGGEEAPRARGEKTLLLGRGATREEKTLLLGRGVRTAPEPVKQGAPRGLSEGGEERSPRAGSRTPVPAGPRKRDGAPVAPLRGGHLGKLAASQGCVSFWCPSSL